ncbi:MAG TPA: hypothetical protein VMM37_00225 [Bacteroidota bacterium]|nr:hypothetical protein [Bacteroidota bacterium]
MAEVPKQKIAALEKKVGTGAKSPLFAQLAAYYVQSGKAQEALQMCDAGLAVFPHYTTGHLVKGKALLALKMNAEARREFEIVHDFLPANEAVSFILSNIQPGEGESLEASPAQPVGFEVPAAPAEEPVTEAPAAAEEQQVQAEVATEAEVAPTTEEPSAFALPAENATTDTTDSGFGATPGESETGAVPAGMATEPAPAAETEDPFGLVSGTGGATDAPTAPAASEEAVNPFEDFPDQPGAPAVQEGEESFEAYSARMRGELEGENTMTLDEFLNTAQEAPPTESQEPPAASPNTIENLAEKLQTAKKITPVIDFSTKATIPASEEDTPQSTGFVTPTLAEIYAKQGWYDDAIKAYHTLIITKPAEKERFEKRIAELEELKKQQS